jgi:CHAT domain-containing protein
MVFSGTGESPDKPRCVTPEKIVARASGGVGVIHLAAHGGEHPHHAELAAIELANETGDRRFWWAWQIADSRIPAELVYLSLCSSGRGPVVVGEGALSLARAFLIAGARCIVVTLWPVNDQFAADFAPAFYRAWRKDVSAAEALASAQRRFSEYPPSGWAAFTVLGDGATTRTPTSADRGISR